MLAVSAAGWAATLAVVGGLFAVDVGLSARRPHAVAARRSLPLTDRW